MHRKNMDLDQFQFRIGWDAKEPTRSIVSGVVSTGVVRLYAVLLEHSDIDHSRVQTLFIRTIRTGPGNCIS